MTGIGASSPPLDPLVDPYIEPTGPPVEAAKFGLAKVEVDPPTLAIPTDEEVLKSLAQARILQWKVTAARVISVLGSFALGMATAAAMSGVLITPAGWALAGAAVFIGLAGSYYYGGPKKFLETLMFSVTSFSLPIGPGAVWCMAHHLCQTFAGMIAGIGLGTSIIGLGFSAASVNFNAQAIKEAYRNLCTAIEEGDIGKAKQLISSNIPLDYDLGNNHLTPLAIAIKHGRTEIIPLLLKLRVQTEWGLYRGEGEIRTALGYAFKYAKPDCLKIMLQHIHTNTRFPHAIDMLFGVFKLKAGTVTFKETMDIVDFVYRTKRETASKLENVSSAELLFVLSQFPISSFWRSLYETAIDVFFKHPAAHQYRKRYLEQHSAQSFDFTEYPLLLNAKKELELERIVEHRQQALLINKDRFPKDCFLSDGRTTYPCSSALLKGNSNYFKDLDWSENTQNAPLSFRGTLYQNNIKDVVDHIYGKTPIVENEQLKEYFSLHEFGSEATNFAMLFDSSITQANQVHDDVFEESISQFNRDTVLAKMNKANPETVKQCIEFLYKRNASHLESTDEVLSVAQLCRQIGVDLAIQAELGSRYFEIVLNRENGLASIPEVERTAIQTFGGLPVNYVNLEGLNLKGGSDDLEVLLSLISPQMPPKLDLTRVSSAQLAAITERFGV